MATKIPVHFLVRGASLVCLSVTLALEFLLPGGFAFTDVPILILASSLVLLLSPKSRESLNLSLWFAAGLTLLVISLEAFTRNAAYPALSAMLSLTVYYSIRAVRRYRHLQSLFSVNEIWFNVEHQSSLLSVCMVSLLMTASIAFHGCAVAGIILSSLSAILFAVLYYSAYSGRSMLMGAEREDTLKEMIRGAERTRPDSGEETRAMQDMYMRLVSLMESRKLYLDEKLNISRLAMSLGTNRTYLSRTINLCSGRNVRAFINSYRVNYAMELIRRNPRIRIGEIVSPSGFCSFSALDMAFRIQTGMSPSEYAMTVSMERFKSAQGPPSRNQEQGQ